ncbi:hypothetical protein EVAR_49035_1 [Eumeta japonica]|uniref:Uncharacterized protein n=1 Tax=Eumeta variegata TaxID=151549 RepID=A0A4C1XSP8_EUMVA|nr:hypothetical protein EVAR_49035_1 [Eumeta japonica]
MKKRNSRLVECLSTRLRRGVSCKLYCDLPIKCFNVLLHSDGDMISAKKVRSKRATRDWVVIAEHGHWRLQRCRQCVAGLLDRNAISDGEGMDWWRGSGVMEKKRCDNFFGISIYFCSILILKEDIATERTALARNIFAKTHLPALPTAEVSSQMRVQEQKEDSASSPSARKK